MSTRPLPFVIIEQSAAQETGKTAAHYSRIIEEAKDALKTQYNLQRKSPI